ncbi:PREDICTED: proton pump-interactor 2 [Tarenaya hassleriana]|uniref:proton pump-interactor 2 n=1 Tax=Tarenaya hassleriana TaxID=28532 RepID=UPI00053C10C4|nr:PREDICTED: proton pump-interactor 2 [Tarenaya hassleriana]XP_010545837.1 PREDICTED: proton pump-interactor 2 [Tarenaya hassleriana]
MVSRNILSDGFEVAPPLELDELLPSENYQSDSNGDESTVTTEDDDAVFSGDSPPSDAADEWPSPKSFRSFYFVKQHPCDDSEIAAKIDEADKEIYRCNVTRIQISESLRAKRAERSALFSQMECLKSERDGYDAIFDERKRELQPLQEALRKLHGNGGGGQLCSSEKELDDLIYRMNYRIEHESITLTEEKQLLKEIKQLEATRGKIIANSAIKAQIQDSFGRKESIIDRVKSMAMNMDEVKKDRLAVTAKIYRLSEKLRRIKMEIESLDAELAGVLDKRDKAFETIKRLRRQRDLRNAAFFQNWSVMMRARELAASGNVKCLEELANAEVEKFMSLWNTDKAFRDDYEERVSASLDERRLGQDGRIKSQEEDVSVSLETLEPPDTATGGVDKWGREDSSSCSSQDGNVAAEKTEKDGEIVTDSNKSGSEENDCMDLDIGYQNLQVEDDIDEETLKEKRREEQLEKARQATERKKKMLEKAAAKAAIREQKEAQKKLKDLEKKAKKKVAATSSGPVQQGKAPETVTKASKPEKAESLALVKEKRSVFPKQRSFRYRHRGRGTEALPKAILKRRKAYRLWVWGAAAAFAAFALALVFFAFFYVKRGRE